MKLEIEKIVDDYKLMFPDEYSAMVKYMIWKSDQNIDDFGDLTKNTDYIEKYMGEVPETLFTMIHNRLSPEDYTDFESKEGKRWFFKKYKEFTCVKQ